MIHVHGAKCEGKNRTLERLPRRVRAPTSYQYESTFCSFSPCYTTYDNMHPWCYRYRTTACSHTTQQRPYIDQPSRHYRHQPPLRRCRQHSSGSELQVLLRTASRDLVVATAANLTGHAYSVNNVDELVAAVLLTYFVLVRDPV